jgi:hypothetical protein
MVAPNQRPGYCYRATPESVEVKQWFSGASLAVVNPRADTGVRLSEFGEIVWNLLTKDGLSADHVVAICMERGIGPDETSVRRGVADVVRVLAASSILERIESPGST